MKKNSNYYMKNWPTLKFKHKKKLFRCWVRPVAGGAREACSLGQLLHTNVCGAPMNGAPFGAYGNRNKDLKMH